jgi:hypothetical protein
VPALRRDDRKNVEDRSACEVRGDSFAAIISSLERPMKDPEKKTPRLVALCVLGCLLLNYPILALFNVSGFVLGIPVLYAYIFTAWAVLIASIALAVGVRH